MGAPNANFNSPLLSTPIDCTLLLLVPTNCENGEVDDSFELICSLDKSLEKNIFFDVIGGGVESEGTELSDVNGLSASVAFDDFGGSVPPDGNSVGALNNDDENDENGVDNDEGCSENSVLGPSGRANELPCENIDELAGVALFFVSMPLRVLFSL